MPKRENYEELSTMPTLVTTILEQTGVYDYIDDQVGPDSQRILTPGKGMKLMTGALFLDMGRRPMYNFDRNYMQVPVDMMCGESVSMGNFNAWAFLRTLDDLFNLDLTQMTFDIYSILGRRCV